MITVVRNLGLIQQLEKRHENLLFLPLFLSQKPWGILWKASLKK